MLCQGPQGEYYTTVATNTTVYLGYATGLEMITKTWYPLPTTPWATELLEHNSPRGSGVRYILLKFILGSSLRIPDTTVRLKPSLCSWEYFDVLSFLQPWGLNFVCRAKMEKTRERLWKSRLGFFGSIIPRGNWRGNQMLLDCGPNTLS